jgi:type IV secretory pathway TraG/TraD family ATPase VirD4
VGLIFGHQALGDLEHYGKDIKNIILSNSNNKIILKNDDPETVDYFVNTIGTQTVMTPVESFSTKSGTTTPAGFTKRIEEQYVIQPSDLRSIVLGEAIVKIDTIYGRLIQKIHFNDLRTNLHEGRNLYRPRKAPVNVRDNFVIMEEETETRTEKLEPGDVPEGFITVKDLRKRAKKQDKEEGKESIEGKGKIVEEGVNE